MTALATRYAVAGELYHDPLGARKGSCCCRAEDASPERSENALDVDRVGETAIAGFTRLN
jgi:hypothetical protein